MDKDPRRLADYFVVAGISDEPSRMQDTTELEDKLPITDITVVIASKQEQAPLEYHCIERTPSGYWADLNHGSIRFPTVFLCYRRGVDKPPLTDIGKYEPEFLAKRKVDFSVLYEDKQEIMHDSERLETTPYGRVANVNNSSSRTFLTFRRASVTSSSNSLVVKDICVILASKGETPPHAYCKIDRNLNQGVLGADVYICYKKSVHRPPLILYRPETILRFPKHDNPQCPLPQEVHLFSLPLGATVEKWKTCWEKNLPEFATFVFTSQTATRAYGASLTFYEPYEPNAEELALLGGVDEKEKCYATKSICLVSRYPFFKIFKKFLQFIFSQSTSQRRENSIEQYILHFLYNVRLPSVERPRVTVPLNSDHSLALRHLTDAALPTSGASFVELLDNLGPDNCILTLLLVLTENKILIHSLRPELVSFVTEALVSGCFPLSWQCPYVPLCPLGLAEILMAPLPFLVGVDSRYFDLHELPADVICVDLDTNSIYIPEEKQYLHPRMMPKRATRKLRQTLSELFQKVAQNRIQPRGVQATIKDKTEADFAVLRRERDLDLRIQEAFLKFMVETLRDFRQFLRPVTEKPKNVSAKTLFDVENFLRTKDRAHQDFYWLLVETQMFCRLVEERSFLSENDHSLAFFDQCCDQCDQSGEAADDLLHIEACEDNHTAYIAPPEPPQDPELLKFKGWTQLTFDNFSDAFANEQVPDESDNRLAYPADEYAGSPVIKRTEHEVKSAIKCARQQNEVPARWGRVLLSACYSIWFVHLPSYLATIDESERPAGVRMAFQILCDAQQRLSHPVDEVCYRVILSQCAILSQPALAVKVLMEMKQRKIFPNAMTHGYYNKAVMVSSWPQSKAWKRLKNVINGVTQFKTALRKSRTASVAASTTSLEGITRMPSTLSLPRSYKETYMPSAGVLMGGTATSRQTTPTRTPTNTLRRSKSCEAALSMEKCIKEGSAVIKFKTLPASMTLLEQPREYFAKTVSPSLQRMGNYGSALLQSFLKDRSNLSKIRRFSAGPTRQPDVLDLSRPSSSPIARAVPAGGINVMGNIRSMASRFTSMINTDSGRIPASRSLDQMFNKQPPHEASYNGFTHENASGKLSSGPVHITISSCCQCISCKSLVYDEEVMSGWTADDSNLKTKCWCNASFVPQLYVTIKDRSALHKEENVVLCDFTVPYLSPLVLQKEVENVLEAGSEIFARPYFVDEHPIIYWNLVWYFHRLKLPTNISQLLIRSGILHKGLQSTQEDSTHLKPSVIVKTLWDNPKLHECITPPLYTVYKPGDLYIDVNDPSGFKRAGRTILDHMKSGSEKNVRDAVLFLMKERQKWKFRRNPSIYREILFLLILEFGANIINPVWLYREYRRVYDELSTNRNQIFRYDRYPSPHAQFARMYFGDLDLF